MPIHLDVFHPNRIVVVVARGPITTEETLRTIQEFVEKGMVHYRKIIDISLGRSQMDPELVEKVAAFVRAAPQGAKRGPLAFVVDRIEGNPMAQYFAELTESERPVKVFTSLSEARRWLDENSTI